MASNVVKGFDITSKTTLSDFAKKLSNVGFQATELGRAVEIIEEMKKDGAFILLTFTSNMVSSGLRDVIAELCKRKFIDGIITGIGSIEEDVMKIKNDFQIASFNEDDAKLHSKGLNRIGNIIVPTENYIILEKLDMEFYSSIYEKYKEKRPNGKYRAVISPSDMANEYGIFIEKKFSKEKGLNSSFVYWCSKNKIPICLPAPTDGAMGMHLAFFRQDKDLCIDVAADMTKFGNILNFEKKVGAIILGGGFAKHHTIGLNILRGGLNYAVYVSTGTQYDGSMSGARTNEAVSWGKINEKAKSVYVEGDATIIFPIMISPFLK